MWELQSFTVVIRSEHGEKRSPSKSKRIPELAEGTCFSNPFADFPHRIVLADIGP